MLRLFFLENLVTSGTSDFILRQVTSSLEMLPDSSHLYSSYKRFREATANWSVPKNMILSFFFSFSSVVVVVTDGGGAVV